MRIWIDLANSPHVPFFRPLANEFVRRGHDVVVTARQFAETVPLAEAAGFTPQVIGGHGGAKLSGKAGNLVGRGLELARWARGKQVDLAVSHNSYSQILAARALSLRSVTQVELSVPLQTAIRLHAHSAMRSRRGSLTPRFAKGSIAPASPRSFSGSCRVARPTTKHRAFGSMR